MNSTCNAPHILESQPIEDIDVRWKFCEQGRMIRERVRIGKARHAYNTLMVIWNNENIHTKTKTKLQLFNCNIRQLYYMAQ